MTTNENQEALSIAEGRLANAVADDRPFPTDLAEYRAVVAQLAIDLIEKLGNEHWPHVETEASIEAWRAQTFGNYPSRQKMVARMNREMAELVDAVADRVPAEKIVEEVADVVIVAYGVAGCLGLNLHNAIDAKMAVNRKRTWRVKEGIGHHVHDDPAEKSAAESASEAAKWRDASQTMRATYRGMFEEIRQTMAMTRDRFAGGDYQGGMDGLQIILEALKLPEDQDKPEGKEDAKQA